MKILFSNNSLHYTYYGPYYKFNQYLGSISLETYAASKKKAVTNFKYQIRKRLGLLKSVPIKIDEDKVKAE